MAALTSISFVLPLFIVMAQTRFFSSPCDEMTYGVPAGQVYNVNPSCTEGSISWSYPRDTLRLLFAPTDLKDYKFAVCFKLYANDSSYDVMDVTKGDKQPCKRISDTEVCTDYHIDGVLADVEPKGPLRFMDEIRYRAVTTEQQVAVLP
ncbi:hypothetical protein CHS0354_003312 [Potamilus streckersoni]|uniref:Uncharacterized protein n=1 Tax=Potamilus streckersoni TaxID=2493646 RepID=A0AAE0VPI0_9BIVA|nr:hypothetical protein CHS0354_003312 [Potamilus streckersoni]